MNSPTTASRTNNNFAQTNPGPATAKSAPSAAGQDVSQKNKKNPPTKPAAPVQTAAAPDDSASPQHSPKSELRETVFRFEAPAAREVLLAADFTEWEKAPIKLIKGGGGVWHAKIPLAPGRHLYQFVVDGEWHNDPTRTEREPNSFGTTNSVIEVS